MLLSTHSDKEHMRRHAAARGSPLGRGVSASAALSTYVVRPSAAQGATAMLKSAMRSAPQRPAHRS